MWLSGARKTTQEMQIARECDAKKLKEDLSKPGGEATKRVAQRLGKSQAQPIMFLKRDQQGALGQPEGTITTDPKELENIVKMAWKKIYDDTNENCDKAAWGFVQKYRKYILPCQRIPGRRHHSRASQRSM